DVRVVDGSLPKLPFTDRSFDRIFCISTLEHVGTCTARSGCRELRRVLKPGGRLVLTVDYFVNLAAWRRARGGRPAPDWLPLDENLSPQDLLSVSGLDLIRNVRITDFDVRRGAVTTYHESGLVATSWGMVAQRSLTREDDWSERFVFSPTTVREGRSVGAERA